MDTSAASKNATQLPESRFVDQKINTFFDTVLSKTAEVPASSARPSIHADSVHKTEEKPILPFSRATLPTLNDFATTFTIDCNSCGNHVTNVHYHCSKCELGDFDLCPGCIESGVTCNGEDHWLIKRSISNGKVFTSNTETLPPKIRAMPPPVPAAPEAFKEIDQRTCNSCIIRKSPLPLWSMLTSPELGAQHFVTCKQCADYDLCFFCLETGEHGHHPAHTFEPVDPATIAIAPFIGSLCAQGRGTRHDAVCDGCDGHIVGVRHKCLSCPDFDYCSTCVLSAPQIHPGHRFAPLFEQLGNISTRKEHHRGIYCDGPICSAKARKSYIRGDRYKCAICHDTDFCANCEAYPTNGHNQTHPLIKVKTPLHGLNITTMEQPVYGEANVLGDMSSARNASTETVSTAVNAATQVQTVAETAPVEIKSAEPEKTDTLEAHFESESTPDGTTVQPNRLISQSWTLRNVGPATWPIGCAVHYIGGDDMRNVDAKHPSPVSSMTLASSSNGTTKPVLPGESHTFTVTLRTPAKTGRAVSYWRVKTIKGLPFGHKLWCDVVVTTPVEVAAVVPVEAPVEEAASSQMIFPTLEKESPESSISDVRKEVATDPSVTSEHSLVDDLESMAIEDDSDTEDGFVTDDEYDILDAEDDVPLTR